PSAPTSRDFVPWRFSDAGCPSVRMVSACRHPKTCTKSEVNRRVHSSPSLALGLVLPVLPLHIIDFQVAGNGCANGWEKILLAKLREQYESLQLVLYWIFQFGKAQLDTLRVQRLVQFGDCIAGGDVHAGDWLRRNDQPAHRRRRFRHGVQNALFEEFSVGEE